MNKKYTYERYDGGTTDCFGDLNKESNIEVTCDDESRDTILTGIDMTNIWNWRQLAKHLEATYYQHIEQLIAV